MSRPSEPSHQSAITVAIIGGIFTVIAAVIGLGGHLIDRLVIPPTIVATQPSNTVFAAPPISPMFVITVVNPTPVLQAESPTQVPVAPTVVLQVPSPTQDLVALEKPNLMAAVRLLGDAEAQAQATLDPTPLSRVLTGEALRQQLDLLTQLSAIPAFTVAVRHDLVFEEFTVSTDGTHATVRAKPTWETRTFSAITRQCIGYVPPTAFPQTLYLEKAFNGWLTYAIAFDNTNLPAVQPC